MKDGLAYEMLYQREVDEFAGHGRSMDHDALMAAVLLRAAGKLDLLTLLYRDEIVPRDVGDDDKVENLSFRIK